MSRVTGSNDANGDTRLVDTVDRVPGDTEGVHRVKTYLHRLSCLTELLSRGRSSVESAVVDSTSEWRPCWERALGRVGG